MVGGLCTETTLPPAWDQWSPTQPRRHDTVNPASSDVLSQHCNQRHFRSSSSITQCSHINIKHAPAMKYRTIPGRESHTPARRRELRAVCCVHRLKHTAHHPFAPPSRPRYDLAVDRKIKAQFGCHERGNGAPGQISQEPAAKRTSIGFTPGVKRACRRRGVGERPPVRCRKSVEVCRELRIFKSGPSTFEIKVDIFLKSIRLADRVESGEDRPVAPAPSAPRDLAAGTTAGHARTCIAPPPRARDLISHAGRAGRRLGIDWSGGGA